ncbi:hypothetical protein RhiirA4_452798 [Rhizophagus irregularis]|uniref:Uncharacterized protein n=1 Tax=Rhizophagus irregularis TaxID=588596 RepID=A0A2I1FYX9_9GLOM|nr:hypothetical protein RhiirA4_452798 [Rhizophagus irregularis]
MYTKNGMLDASNFYYDYKDIVLDGRKHRDKGIILFWWFKEKDCLIIYDLSDNKSNKCNFNNSVIQETKPIIITTEEAVILEEAKRSPPVVPGYTMPYSQMLEEMASGYESDIEINAHSADEEKPDGYDPSISNRKRKHDLEINEELHDEVYYKLLSSILKISETIQSTHDYREKSYVVRDKNEKEKYRIMANKKIIKILVASYFKVSLLCLSTQLQ